MTIQRQYSLPNCKLILQGLNNSADMGSRPLLSMVTNVECYLAGQKDPLTGGREFLESLATAVSNYAQSYLSGIQHLLRRDQQNQAGQVSIEQVGENLHRLTVKSDAGQSAQPMEVTLTTVQFFDLVEAIDQLFADGQTLPELGLKLDPLPKRYVVSQEPFFKRATPPALGLAGLATAAALMFMIPLPEARRPTQTAEGTTTTEQASPTPSPGSSAASPPPPSPSAATSPSPTTASSPNSTSSSSPSVTSNAGAGTDLANTPNITDAAELDRLTVQLYDKLDLAWKKTPTFDGELIYRVGVNQNGDVIGYKYANDAALTYVTDTPLADLRFNTPASSSSSSPEATNSSPEPASSPNSGSTSSRTALAQFRVVFKSDGVLEVSPWDGQPGSTPSNSPASSPSP